MAPIIGGDMLSEILSHLEGKVDRKQATDMEIELDWNDAFSIWVSFPFRCKTCKATHSGTRFVLSDAVGDRLGKEIIKAIGLDCDSEVAKIVVRLSYDDLVSVEVHQFARTQHEEGLKTAIIEAIDDFLDNPKPSKLIVP